MDYAELTGKETVIDAYCGTGTIGLIAARNAKRVIGVELNKDAVKDARINAKENGIKNAEIYAGDAGRFMVDKMCIRDRSYGVNDEGVIDYDKVREIAVKEKPKMIIAGASAYARIIDFKKFREIADEVGAYLMVDMAHIAGLVAAGLHPSPIPYADVTTTTTHKTLRGPRGGLILCNQEAADKFNFNKAVFPGIQGGPLEHVIAGKAVCFKEALEPEFAEYQKQIIKNAQALSKGLMGRGVKIISGGTDNHLMLIDLRGEEVTGKELEKRLDAAHITCNKNTVPNDPRSPFVTSGVRLGTPAVTTRGLKEEDMDVIAECIALVLQSEDNIEKVKGMVAELTAKYPLDM